jgi:hypothetical protein
MCFFVSGCGRTRINIFSNPKGIKGIYAPITGHFIPLENPKYVVTSNRPLKAKTTINADGSMTNEIDATNKNNVDKVLENILPLIALKEA